MTLGLSGEDTDPQTHETPETRTARSIHIGKSSFDFDLLPLGGIVLLATIVILPVFVKGFPSGFDAVRHYRWTTQFIDAMRDGAIYPRWLPSANEGQGSPVPLYYPPLSFYVAAAFSTVSGNTLRAIEFSCWLALALSGLTMYALSRSVLSAALSFAAAALYILAPYHLLDLYQGASPSEFWAFVWPPLLLLAVNRVHRGAGLTGAGFLAVGYAVMILTHVPVAFLTTLALAVYSLSLTRKPSTLVRIALGGALGAGVAAIFLIPVLFETRYIWLFFKFDYRDYFLFEHLRGAFTSTRFPVDSSVRSYLLDTDFVAVAPLVLFLCGSVLIWINRREVRAFKQNAKWSGVVLAIWVVTGFSVLMTTRLSAPIWRIIPGLTFLFYPWRWLVIGSLGAALVPVFALSRLKGEVKWRALKIGALAVAVIFNLAISVLMIWRAPHDPKGLEEGLLRRDTREYRPMSWDGQLRSELWRTPARVDSGDCNVVALDDAGIKQSYSVTATTESVITLRPLYFPGWAAAVDGKAVTIRPSEEGNIQLTIEAGTRALTLTFEDTWPRSLGKAVSAISCLILICALYLGRRRHSCMGGPPWPPLFR
jgi:hypothetical protein